MRFTFTTCFILIYLFLLPVAIAQPPGGVPRPPSKDVIQLMEDVEQLQQLVVAQEDKIAILQSDVSSNDTDIDTLFAQVGKAHWATSYGVELTSSSTFVDIPETFVAFDTVGEAKDMTIHFCGQIDNQTGGRTMLRVNIDGADYAEPDTPPGPIVSWDGFFPKTNCMIWVAPQVEAGPHVISVQWMHDIGGTESRIAYRTLVVYY